MQRGACRSSLDLPAAVLADQETAFDGPLRVVQATRGFGVTLAQRLARPPSDYLKLATDVLDGTGVRDALLQLLASPRRDHCLHSVRRAGPAVLLLVVSGPSADRHAVDQRESHRRVLVRH